MRSRQMRVIGAIFSLVIFSVIVSQIAMAYDLDYSNKTMYFSGHRMNGWSPPSGVSAVNPIYFGERFPNGETEPNAYMSSGNVIPNKAGRYAIPGDSSNYGGYGGAIGFNALGLVDSGSGQRNDSNRKQKLFNFLRSKYDSGSSWEKMGAAFVAQQMVQKAPVGGPWGESARNFNDWDDLERRFVNNPSITMTYDPSYWVLGVQNTNGVQYRQGGKDRIDVIDNVLRGSGSNTQAAWVFRDTSKGNAIVYVLEVNCANPIGGFGGFDEAENDEYSLVPSITSPADGTSIRRGEAATATGRVINNGPDNAGSKTWYVTRLIYNVGNNPSKGSRTSNGNGGVCAEFAGNNGCATEERSQTFNNGQTRTGGAPAYNVPTNAAPGTQICYVASVRNPTHNTNPVWRHSAMQCFRVAPPSYNLDPSVTSSRGEDPVVEPGNNVQITPRVENKGEDESGNTIWELTRMIYDPSTTVTGNDKRLRNSGNEPCTEFRLSGNPNPTECENIFRLNNETWDGGETRNGAVTSYSVPDNLEAGTKICFATSVSRPTYNATPVWRHSAWWCMTIGKKPKVQVWGGDVRAGGSINTSVTEIPSRGSYGSWVEYAALSRGPNSGFGSGAGLINGDRANDQGLWSNFTFANIDGNRGSCTAMYGCFESLPLVSALAGQFGQGSNPRALTGANLNSQYNSAATSYTAGDITLSASTISSGRSMVIIASGTVTISGDISYSDGSYSNLRDIPQVVIIAPTINIQNSVGRVDAWLLAGVLNTCSDSTGALTISRCNRPLEINGPVVANQIHLRRTAGSGAQADQRGEPAERFNLRADAFLWAYGYRSDASRAQTVYVKEMAPRF